MLRRDTLALTALLAMLTAVGPISVDMYLPSLPDIGRALDASVPQVQLTLSGFLLCFAVGQIIYGPLSDHVGRKPVLQTALAIFVAASIGCALTPFDRDADLSARRAGVGRGGRSGARARDRA